MKISNFKNKNGITLIALVITIIVLLILAAISITMLTGDNSILKRATDAKEHTSIAKEKEQIKLEVLGSYETNGGLLIGTVNNNIKNHINDVTTDEATSFPLTVTYTTTGNRYIVEANGDVREVVIVNGSSNDWQLNDQKDTIVAYIGGEFDSDTLIVPNYVDGNKITKLGNGSMPISAMRLTELQGKKIEITEGIEELSSNSFIYYSIFTGGIRIPDSITYIGNNAFRGANFNGPLYIGKNLATIGDSPFADAVFQDISINAKNIPVYLFLEANTLRGTLTLGENVESIGKGAFQGCSGLNGNLVIPNSVSEIGEYAFQNCSGLNGNLVIPNSVTEIGQYAFNECSGLDGTLTISNKIENIHDGIFRYCSNLKGDLIIPEGTKTIGYNAFYECSGFDGTLRVADSIEKICGGAFYNCTNIKDLYVGNNLTYDSINNTYFLNVGSSKGLNSIVVNTKNVPERLFYMCNLSGPLTLGNSVETIGENAFLNCSGLSGNLIIPNSVTAIGEGAFEGCTGLTGVVNIPSGVTSIPTRAFQNCTSLTKIVVQNSVTEIGYNAFQNVPLIQYSGKATGSPWGAVNVSQ